jgi:hypothetical protein
MTENTAPQVHPAQYLSAPDGTQADIDTEIVPLVRALWALGLTTTASCQDFGEGTAGQRKADQHPSRYGGDAFIAYYTGWAWLKMPVPDAQRLVTLLLATEFHDKVTRRWQPGSWRMHIPLVFEEGSGITPASTAQIHFPRAQTASLTRTLEHIPANRPEQNMRSSAALDIAAQENAMNEEPPVGITRTRMSGDKGFSELDDSALLSRRAQMRAELERLPAASPGRAALAALYEMSTREVNDRATRAWARAGKAVR